MGIFDMTPDRMVQLAGISDAFGALRNDGGGPRRLPMAMQYRAQQEQQEKLQQALQRAREGGGSPAGVNPAAFDALASVDPAGALQMMASPASQPDPWRNYKVVGGSVVKAGPDGVQSVYDAPRDDATKARSAIAKLTQDYRDGLIDEETFKSARAKALRDPNGITIGPDGTVQIGGGAPKLTEVESKGLIYFDRANAAEAILNQHQEQLTSLSQGAASSIPGVGNYLVSDEFQQAQQAGREFLAAVLRKDTGAAITQQEFDLYGPMYLPQPGDSAAVLKQKQNARKIAVDSIQKTLGKGSSVADPRTGGANDTVPIPKGPRQTINGVIYEQRNGKWGIVQ